MSKKATEAAKSSRISLIDFINSQIDMYLKQDGTQKRTTRKKISRIRDKKLLYRALDARIMVKSGMVKVKLLALGFYLNREKYILECLNLISDIGIKLENIGFFDSINEKPLTDNEMNSIAEHIGTCKNFDTRLIACISGDKLELALNGVLKRALENGLEWKDLSALARKKQYLEPIQGLLREEMKNDVSAHKSWMQFLDLSDPINRALIEKWYSIYDIIKYVKPCSYFNQFDDSFSLRLTQQIQTKSKIASQDWDKLKGILRQDMNSKNSGTKTKKIISFLGAIAYIDTEYVEEQLICIFKTSEAYAKDAITELAKCGSNFAYLELLNVILSTEDMYERYSSAVQVVRYFPHKAPYLLDYCEDLEDERLLNRIKEVADKYDISLKKDNFEVGVELVTAKVQIVPHSVLIPELINMLAKRMEASVFYAAVGFIFESGLKLLLHTMDVVSNNNGRIEIVAGSLQRFQTPEQCTKINKKTVQMLNKLVRDRKVSLYTNEEKFYHGKFYYLANETRAYVIIGSSNISKTAYVGNDELDCIISVDLNSAEDNQYIKWYDELKSRCTEIMTLDSEKFMDLNWKSELDAYSEHFLKRMTVEKVIEKMQGLTDDERKLRIQLWLNHGPSDIFENFGVASLREYFLMLFSEYSLAVFESFEKGNAYYVFNYLDIEELLNKVARLSKTGLQNQSELISRGYHIQDLNRLEDKIGRFFEREKLTKTK